MNQPRQGNRNGPVAAFFIFVWDAMNFVRRLAFNILFFGLLLILLIAMASAGRVKPMLDETTLVIAPEGMLVEQYSIDPGRSEEHTSELQSLMRISYAVFCL